MKGTQQRKFSILLPTKDRLELLKYAVKSVLMQNYDNWELIISDNCSSVDIRSWVKTIGDDRVMYIRQESPLSVTENWNAANDAASGDYKIMLGDDDALLPGALRLLDEKITEYGSPDLIVFPGYTYLQKNVDPVLKEGDLTKDYALQDYHDEQFLDINERRQMVWESCQLKRCFGYNMQYYCYSKVLEDKVKTYGNFYEPPYPDHYTANLMMYMAERVLNLRDEIIIIGISPKSYGYYYRNNIEKDGMAFHKEADFREYAPASIKNKLCSVDEQDTAVAATFALLEERVEALSVNISNYYRKVIKNQVQYLKKEDIEELMRREIFPNISEEEKSEIILFFEECMADYSIKRDAEQVLGTRPIPYNNILQIIEDFEQIKPEIEKGGGIDLYYWKMQTNFTELKTKCEGKKVYIWGAYLRGKRIREWLDEQKIAIAGYIDSDEAKKNYDTLSVYQPETVLKQPNTIVILAHKRIFQSVRSLLEKCHYISEDDHVYINNGE